MQGRGFEKTKLGEEFIDPATTLPLPLALLEKIFEIDLMLVLETGPAPLIELAYIHANYYARQITCVWYKREYMTGQRSVPMDIVRSFENHAFSPEEFEQCDLTEEFAAAADRFCFNKAQREGMLADLGLLPPGQ